MSSISGMAYQERLLESREYKSSPSKTWRRLSLTSLPPFLIDIGREHSFTLLPRNYQDNYSRPKIESQL